MAATDGGHGRPLLPGSATREKPDTKPTSRRSRAARRSEVTAGAPDIQNINKSRPHAGMQAAGPAG